MPGMSWAFGDSVPWNCALLLLLLLMASCRESRDVRAGRGARAAAAAAAAIGRRGAPARWRPCDEYYMVREGETLQSIIEKCKDPFILEVNPHILDFDYVYPGLVIKITAAAGSADSSDGK